MNVYMAVFMTCLHRDKIVGNELNRMMPIVNDHEKGCISVAVISDGSLE